MFEALLAEVLILIMYSVDILLSISIFTLIGIHCRSITADVSLFLTCNTYLSLHLFCLSGLAFHINTIYGVLHLLAPVDDRWCHVAFSLPFFSLCSLYFSYVIQALFRFFRIVFSKQKNLQSFRVTLMAIGFQWCVAFIITLLFLPFEFTKFLPSERNCQIPFDNVVGFFAMLTCIYLIPISIIFVMYAYMLQYIRRMVHSHPHRQNANERDMTVLRRILLLALALVVLGFPTLLIAMIYWITRSLAPSAYIIRDLSVAIGVLLEIIVLAYITPQIRTIFARITRRVHPALKNGTHQTNKATHGATN